MSKKNESFLSRLFSHNITLLIIAFLIAFSAWFIIKISSDNDTPKTIKNIPITIELPETAKNDGLKVFALNQENAVVDDNGESTNLTASVEVKGNPIIVAGLKSSDIKVSASQTSTIVSPGSYVLPLTAKKATLKSDYDFEISNLNQSSITIYVDVEKEETFTIENQVSVKLKDANHFANVSMSQNEVTVSGPQTQINKIKTVAIKDTLESDSQQTLLEELVFLDENGDTLELPYVTTDISAVEVTVTVQPAVEVKLGVDLVNAPSEHPDVKVSPDKLKITGSQEVLDEIKDNKVSIGTLDFSTLDNDDHEITMAITLPDGCKSTDSSITEATITVDLSEYDAVTVNASIKSNLDTDKYTSDLSSSRVVSVTVYGPANTLSEITASNITVTADFSDSIDKVADSDGAVSVNVPLKVKLKDDFGETCWCAALDPIQGVNVSKK